jgi:hypothetical protein
VTAVTDGIHGSAGFRFHEPKDSKEKACCPLSF